MRLYTIITDYADHLTGMGQHEAGTPLEALNEFIKSSESLKTFNRDEILSALGSDPLIQTKPFKGVWLLKFDPFKKIADANGNSILRCREEIRW